MVLPQNVMVLSQTQTLHKEILFVRPYGGAATASTVCVRVCVCVWVVRVGEPFLILTYNNVITPSLKGKNVEACPFVK